MALQAYKAQNFHGESMRQIERVNSIIDEYLTAGYKLTVRQLYYQLVARGFIENTEKSYKRTVELLNNARNAGLVDWDAIEDRTRDFIKRSRWDSGRSLLQQAADQFHMDMWANQQFRVFVIVEKEALAGVLERVCRKFDVPLLAARGYPSASVLREFAVDDLQIATLHGQDPVMLHLGDHDPSGIDMTRDLTERLKLYNENDVELHRIALTMDQVKEQNPPPNPAKFTDSRFGEYRRRYGDKSWELDALRPDYLNELVENHIDRYIDGEAWDKRVAEIEATRAKLHRLTKRFKG